MGAEQSAPFFSDPSCLRLPEQTGKLRFSLPAAPGARLVTRYYRMFIGAGKMTYVFLALAIIAEVIGTIALKATNGFTVFLPSTVVVVAYVAAFVLLSFCLREIPVGIAYGIWAGLGIVLVTISGSLIYKQVPDVPAIIGLLLIVTGVTIIHLFSKSTGH